MTKSETVGSFLKSKGLDLKENQNKISYDIFYIRDFKILTSVSFKSVIETRNMIELFKNAVNDAINKK